MITHDEPWDHDMNSAFVLRNDLSADDCYDVATAKLEQAEAIVQRLWVTTNGKDSTYWALAGLLHQTREAYRDSPARLRGPSIGNKANIEAVIRW